MKTGLVLEGGGMRGLYTAGVLDRFMDGGISVDYLIGVSAGACNACSFISGQRGRNKRINTGYLDDERYLSVTHYLKTGSMFGMDFIFDEIPNRLDPFDYDAFNSSGVEFVVGVTDASTAKTIYFGKGSAKDVMTIIRASASLPGFAPMVEYDGGLYLDGGTTDPIPFNKAVADGCEKLIVVLTRDASYVKTSEKFFFLYKRIFKNYPEIIEALRVRHISYNKTRERLAEMEREGRALVIMPSSPLPVRRFTKKLSRLEDTYDMGYNDAKELESKIEDFLS